MATEIERPSGPSPVTIIAGLVGVVVLILVVRWITGLFFTMLRIGFIVALIAVGVYVATRLLSGRRSTE